MRKTIISLGMLCSFYLLNKRKTVETKTLMKLFLVGKPTVETKVDRTVLMSNSSILAGNTTRKSHMTPLISIDSNDTIKAEGENVNVYINDRKSVFTGKRIKEYLKTIPADNLLKLK